MKCHRKLYFIRVCTVYWDKNILNGPKDIWATTLDFQQCGLCDQQRLRPACTYTQSDQSFYLWLEYSMSVKLLTEHNLEFLSLKGGCTGSYVSMSKYHIVENHMSRPIYLLFEMPQNTVFYQGLPCADPGIFVRGVQVNLTKKSSRQRFF